MLKEAFTDGWKTDIPGLPYKVTHKDDYCIISILGADTVKEVVEAFHPKYEKYFEYNVHKKTLDKFYKLKLRLFNEIGDKKKVYLVGFLMGASILQIVYLWLTHFGFDVKCYLMNPYKAVNKFPDEIIRNKKDFCSLWPFWKKKPNKIKQIKSPYSWCRIKKNHFYIIEVVMEGKLCLT
jgi:hypothetical protein